MKVIKRATMPNGTKLVLVDWSEDYPFYAYSETINAYPIATRTDYDGILRYPECGKPFLLQLDCGTEENAKAVLSRLECGEMNLQDCEQYMKEQKYLQFIC